MRPDLTPDIYRIYLEAVENELQQAVQRANDFGNSHLYEMLAYHMGWINHSAVKEARGKRLRPLLVLLACSATGGDWHLALPAASAVELVHNFSLIHDDIEDQSPLRRGRPTVWQKWGIPQAINAGDAMFALAHLEAIRLSQTIPLPIAMQAVELLQYTCLQLTEGQFLDLSYETRNDLSIEDYWQMVKGKTAALIATSTELGALAAGGDADTCQLYRHFGHSLGMAFQARDDWLGIWGHTSLTGKSSQSDLVSGKITLPVLYGLSRSSAFASRWKQGPVSIMEVSDMMNLLENEGAKDFTEAEGAKYINEALSILEQAHPVDTYGEGLRSLALNIVNRQA
jgi:geranylgeranyl diphosphate synthase type I